jgi:hypothetical protein
MVMMMIRIHNRSSEVDIIFASQAKKTDKLIEKAEQTLELSEFKKTPLKAMILNINIPCRHQLINRRI